MRYQSSITAAPACDDALLQGIRRRAPVFRRVYNWRRQMNKRDFMRAGAAGTLALGGASLAQAQTGPSYNWKMATGWPGGPLMDIGSKAFAERMALLSGGRFKIQTFP